MSSNLSSCSSTRREERERELLETLAGELEDYSASFDYEIFHKPSSVYTPVSVASTAPTSMLTESLERLKDNDSPNACVHRKWEKLAETWKTTMGAVPPNSPARVSPLFMQEEPQPQQLLRLSPLSNRPPPASPYSPSFHSSMHSSVDADFLLRTPSLNKPFRPYGFEWTTPPSSGGAQQMSRLKAYTNMCVFDRLYGQANIPNSPQRKKTPPASRPTPTKKSPSKKSSTPPPNKKVTSPTRTSSSKKAAKTITKQPWKSSSKYARDFGTPPPPAAVGNKGKDILQGFITISKTSVPVSSRLYQPTVASQSNSATKKVVPSKSKSSNNKKKKKKKKSKSEEPSNGSPDLIDTSANHDNFRADSPAKTPCRVTPDLTTKLKPPADLKSPSPPPWRPSSRSPRSFQMRQVSPEPISTIEIRMRRTEIVKQQQQQQQQANGKESHMPRQWSTPLRPRLEYKPTMQDSPDQDDFLQIPYLESHSKEEPWHEHRRSSIVKLQSWWRGVHSRTITYARHNYSHVTAAGATKTVQSRYRDSQNSIGQKHRLVQAYRQARHRVELEHPLTPKMNASSLSISPSSSWSTTPLSLRDKWKAKQPAHQRQAAAKRIQQWYRRLAARQEKAVRVLQNWYRKCTVQSKTKSRAARTIQLRYQYHRKQAQKQLEDRRAAEILQLCWWRKLSPEESNRVEKATAKQSTKYSYIPLQVQQFVRESRQEQEVKVKSLPARDEVSDGGRVGGEQEPEGEDDNCAAVPLSVSERLPLLAEMEREEAVPEAVHAESAMSSVEDLIVKPLPAEPEKMSSSPSVEQREPTRAEKSVPVDSKIPPPSAVEQKEKTLDKVVIAQSSAQPTATPQEVAIESLNDDEQEDFSELTTHTPPASPKQKAFLKKLSPVPDERVSAIFRPVETLQSPVAKPQELVPAKNEIKRLRMSQRATACVKLQGWSRMVSCRRAYEIAKQRGPSNQNLVKSRPVVSVNSITIGDKARKAQSLLERRNKLKSLLSPEKPSKDAATVKREEPRAVTNKENIMNEARPITKDISDKENNQRGAVDAAADADAVAKVQMMRAKLQVRHIDLSVGEKKLAKEKVRWEGKTPTKSTKTAKVKSPLRQRQQAKASKRPSSTKDDDPGPIDLKALYRNAYAVHQIEVRERRLARVHAAKQIQVWWTTSLLVWLAIRQRCRAATKIQAIYRGRKYSTIYQRLLWCALVIQKWWREHDFRGLGITGKVQQGGVPKESTTQPQTESQAHPAQAASWTAPKSMLTSLKQFAVASLVFTAGAFTVSTIVLIFALYKSGGIMIITE